MKPNKLVQIKNVIRADACIQFLMNRPKTEMVGLGLIYGKPGLGKTTYASRIAFMRGLHLHAAGIDHHSQVLRGRSLDRPLPPLRTG